MRYKPERPVVSPISQQNFFFFMFVLKVRLVQMFHVHFRFASHSDSANRLVGLQMTLCSGRKMDTNLGKPCNAMCQFEEIPAPLPPIVNALLVMFQVHGRVLTIVLKGVWHF